jgi:hypothetical protein
MNNLDVKLVFYLLDQKMKIIQKVEQLDKFVIDVLLNEANPNATKKSNNSIIQEQLPFFK